MERYLGHRCPVCGELFENDSDVVVCPICGTPHHRECYKKLGYCQNEELHESGKSYPFGEEKAEEKEPENTLVCPRCGEKAARDMVFCPTCRFPLKDGGFKGNEAFTPPRPDDEIAGVKAKDLAEYVGPSALGFLHKWKITEKIGGNGAFNFSAFFFGPFYYLYRKVYLWGILFLIFRFISVVPFAILNTAEIANLTINTEFWAIINDAFSLIGTFVNFFAAMFFNKIYLSKAVKDINAGKKGGVSMPAVLLSLTAVMVGLLAVVYFLIK